MHTKIEKILVLSYLLLLIYSNLFAQDVALKGNPSFVTDDETELYEYYKSIAKHIIEAAIVIQTGGVIMNISKNSSKAKKATLKFIGGIAVTTVIWTIL